MSFIKFKDMKNNSSNKVLDIKEDKSGNIWFTTNKGLNKLDNSKNSLIRFKYSEKNLSKISDDNSSKMSVDSNGLIWVGTWGAGFNVLNPVTGKFKHVTHNPGKKDSLRTILFYSYLQIYQLYLCYLYFWDYQDYDYIV